MRSQQDIAPHAYKDSLKKYDTLFINLNCQLAELLTNTNDNQIKQLNIKKFEKEVKSWARLIFGEEPPADFFNDNSTSMVILNFYHWREKMVLNFNPHLFRALTKDTDFNKLEAPAEIWKKLPFFAAYYAIPKEFQTRSWEMAHNKKTYLVQWEGAIISTQGIQTDGEFDQEEDVTVLAVNLFGRVVAHGVPIVENKDDSGYADYQIPIGGPFPPLISLLPMRSDKLIFNDVWLKGAAHKEAILQALTLALYTATENCDLEKRNTAEKVVCLPKTKGVPKFYTGLKVGDEIGKTLDFTYHQSRQKEAAQASLGGTHRPHLRRAHWHTYWTGSTKYGRGEGFQQAAIKWLPPTFVGDDDTTWKEKTVI